MTHRSLMLCVALAVIASASLFTRHGAQQRRIRRRPDAQGHPFKKPPMDVSLTSHSLPF